jgi:hypothetical protein
VTSDLDTRSCSLENVQVSIRVKDPSTLKLKIGDYEKSASTNKTTASQTTTPDSKYSNPSEYEFNVFLRP